MSDDSGDESDESGSSEVELDLSLDENGRIDCPASSALSFEFCVYNDIFRDLRVANARLYTRRFASLCKDCRTLFTAGRSFFIRSDATPHLSLERLALDIFHSHIHESIEYDPSKSWAEYWVQLRTHKPRKYDNDNDKEVKRNKRQRSEVSIENEAEAASMGLSESVAFHYDKDESLTDQTNINVYPHISTVTYLSSCGAPTVICEHVGPSDNSSDLTAMMDEMRVVFPSEGKHVKFDGRLLHGCPESMRFLEKEEERLTFLVNIWIDYTPVDAIDKEMPSEAKKLFSCMMTPRLNWQDRCILPSLKPSKPTTLNTFRFGPTGTEHSLTVPCVWREEADYRLQSSLLGVKSNRN